MTRRPIAWFLGAVLALGVLGLAVVGYSHRAELPTGSPPPTGDM